MPSPRLDRILLAVWLPVWAFAFFESARHFDQPIGLCPVEVAGAAGEDGFPAVTGERRWVQQHAAELRPGDRLLRFGEVELRGASSLDVFLRFAVAARGAASVPLVYERDGATLAAQLPANPARFLRTWLVVSLIYAAVALLLLWRAPSSPMVRAFFQAFMAAAVLFAASPDDRLAVAVEGAALGLTCTLSLLAFQRFPLDAPLGGWARAWPWLFLALAPFHTSRFGAPLPPRVAEPVALAGVFAFFVTLLALTTRNYRLSDAIGRRQLRWVLFGIYLAALPPMLTATLVAIDSRWTAAYALNLAAAGAIPLSLLIAVVRTNLFDVDRLISGAASYNVLLLVALSAGLVLVPQLGDLAAQRLHLDAGASRLAVAVLLTALVLPTQRALRPLLERIFFRERWDVDHGIALLIRQIHDCTDPSQLTPQVGAGLARLLRPELCAVYARQENAFAPVFASGRAIPPAFEADGSLVRVLRARTTPLEGESSRRRGGLALDPFERAALETLGAAVVIPIHGLDLAAFVVLGRKHSGDVYTPTDLALLASIGDQVGARLRDYDQAALVRESREMEQKLRRYVPGAVVQQLASGHESVAGACEVSVLFVDIRGYTSFAEQRRPDEIFSTLNRYTEAVSRLIQGHGGNVVEFNGDGLMAVFGAPVPLAAKERAAVAAASSIVKALEGLDAGAGAPRISVGVGIATGEAYVGDIRSADRMIWSAVGNTTNLAARLQQLTRDWNAAIVIDARTREAAGAAAERFEPRGHTTIRGRRQEEVLYVLPLPAPG
jgi:class 3 adenylate cyclase